MLRLRGPKGSSPSGGGCSPGICRSGRASSRTTRPLQKAGIAAEALAGASTSRAQSAIAAPRPAVAAPRPFFPPGLRIETRRSGSRSELLADLLGEHETDVLVDGAQLGDIARPALAEKLDEPLDQLLRGAGAGGDADGLDALQPLLLHLGVIVDQMGGGAVLARHFDEAIGVGGVGGADHEDQLALPGQLLDRDLAVGGGVTDVV